jgi:hypothetical protein
MPASCRKVSEAEIITGKEKSFFFSIEGKALLK